jgi:hypothetical protein
MLHKFIKYTEAPNTAQELEKLGISQKISASTLILTAELLWAPAHQEGITIE